MKAKYIYTVWLDRKGKWHCWEEVGAELVGSRRYAEESSKKTAEGLVGLRKGSGSWLGKAVAAYCVHAPSRSRALTLAKRDYRERVKRKKLQ